MAASPVTVSFPVIARAVPAFPCSADEFLDQVARETPHWIYHLRIRASHRPESRFTPVLPEQVQQLALRLHLPQAFRVEPREFIHGAIALPPGKRSDYVFGYPATFAAGSSGLAVAVGLVAAARRRPLPSSVLLSGVLEEPLSETLRLSETARIEAKVRLSFGQDDGYLLKPVLDRWYDESHTARWLGPREARTEPGKVRLFVTSDEVDIDPRAFVGSLSTEALPDVSLDHFGQQNFSDLMRRVEELASDGLLLVQVPTVFHALTLLGYNHADAAIRDKHSSALHQPIRVFRVRHSLSPPPPLDDEAEVRLELNRLRSRLEAARAQDVYTRLTIILDQARRLLRCQSGDVVVRDRDPGLLRVLARFCPQQEGLPHFVPCARGKSTHILSEKRTRVVEAIGQDEEHAAALQACDPRTGPFTEAQCQCYLEFLRGIHAYMKIPLSQGEQVLGALYLHRDSAGPFNARLVRLVEALAQRAAEEVVAFLREEREAVERVAPLWGAGSVEDLARRAAGMSPVGLQTELATELARLIRERSGASRVAVRLLSEDRHTLVTVGFSSADPHANQAEQAPSLTWEEKAAASHAIRSGRHGLIVDTDVKSEVPLRDFPPRPRCHAAILLSVGGHVLGVLNVDWDRPSACGPAVLAMLEALAGRYAVALKACNTDKLFAELDRLCAEAARTEAEPNYPRFVTLVARMVGAAEAALFLRREQTGQHHLAFSLRNPDWGEDYCYAPGEGMTGWVALQNRAVRVANLRDQAELAALADPAQAIPAPVWLHKRFFAEEMEGLGFSFLGIPLAVGNEVLGVLRAVSPKAGGFSSYDQHIALSAASRLAGCLLQRREQQTDGRHLLQSLELMTEYFCQVQNRSKPLDEAEGQLLGQIGSAMAEKVGARLGWLWVAGPEGDERLHCRAAWGEVPESSRPTIEPGVVPPLLRDRPFILVRKPQKDSRLASLVEGLAADSRSLLADLQWLAVPVIREGRLLALFFLAISPDRHLGGAWLQSIVGMLQPVGRMIAQGRLAEQSRTQSPASAEAPPAP